MILLKDKNRNKSNVSTDTIDEFEQAILSDSFLVQVKEINRIFSSFLFKIWRLIEVCFEWESMLKKDIKTAPFKKIYFAIHMGGDFHLCLPNFIFSSFKSVYMFDAWPNKHESIIRFANYFNVNILFVTSSQVARIIDPKMKGNCYWIPEGINPKQYKYLPYDEKNIEILALGRKYDLYHEKIVLDQKKKGRQYLYEQAKGKIIFPTREGFVDGLARTKISICFPSNITHPDRSGDIETMTIRYLQSMVSKCLIVGHAPRELVEMFGYNPVVEVDMNYPLKQLDDILSGFSSYIPLIERNYEIVIRHHTWENRWNEIKKKLQ